jgi:CheY-like chemotaxis protein
MGAGASLTEVLDVLTHAIESAAPECLCSVLLLDEQGQQLWAGSGGGLPAEYMRAVNGLMIGPDIGACGSAAYRNETIVVEDIASDLRFAPVKDFVISFSLRACWSVPIRDTSRNVLGTFATIAIRTLEKMGHSVILAKNGHEVLSWLAQQSFDLVLVDLQMPEMDGLTATVTIRQGEMHGGHRIPILAVTAHAMKGDQERCLDAGMDGYISKPIRRSELEETIKSVFDR